MRKSLHGVTWFFVLCFIIYFTAVPAAASQKTYTMKGRIKYIETSHNTVVVDVPLGHKIFRVAGPLSHDAVLKKEGKTASLADFKPGDLVTVRWMAKESGHLVLGLFEG